MSLFLIGLYIGIVTFLVGFLSMVKIQYQDFATQNFLDSLHRCFFVIFLGLFLASVGSLFFISHQKVSSIPSGETAVDVVHY